LDGLGSRNGLLLADGGWLRNPLTLTGLVVFEFLVENGERDACEDARIITAVGDYRLALAVGAREEFISLPAREERREEQTEK
jgi:hypothetical protein